MCTEYLCHGGSYCPERSKATCPVGTVSNTHRMINVLIKSMPCFSDSTVKIGSNRSTEYLCPAGSYCPAGSPAPTPCPAVTLSNIQGMINVTSCTFCDPGKYCNDTDYNYNAASALFDSIVAMTLFRG
ncbi:hypothetical protein MAR_036214 [Mya arenaria]|uniref:Uncharacterized protein n=1 Tax=Mya arenaria TaxID=6604 RepID=A0ABY7ERE9_MYAAR|nr:hypothetical protein MAR_036214 [Mya arenaria]